MATAKEHYENFLASYYSWISGGTELKVHEYRDFFRDQQIRPRLSKIAVDLGAGSGFQSIPLAEAGFQVTAIDMNHDLLAELEKNARGLPIVTVEDDLLNFVDHRPAEIEVIVCMGDTLTHLNSLEDVRNLLESAYRAGTRQGFLLLGFRDLTAELTGLDRFIPVRSDATRIFTCFLEYEQDHVRVYDVLYEMVRGQWQMRKSFFRKLRISPQWTKEFLLKTGYRIQTYDVRAGLVTIVARKP